ncbi:MAG TPA: DUF1638 domain-containing protein [Candidatus Deferrimicrobium sp.]|nr:DUF1638 domain-containing protein [Candidatus Deferrimicrobium sp.]
MTGAPSLATRPERQLRILALTCEVLARSVYLCAARSPHVVDVRLNRRGLHDDPPNLRTILQAQVDESGAPYDAVVLAYGLCGGAIAGLRAGAIPLVVPRAHDCITLFLGSRDRYSAEFLGHPGTYWYVQDYLERTDDGSAFGGVGSGSDTTTQATYDEYVEKYGEDNAAYLMEALGAWRSHYDRAAYVDMGVAHPEAAGLAEDRARGDAEQRGWQFEKLAGELILIRKLIDGDWAPEDMLVVAPGEQLAMSYDEQVIRAVLAAATDALTPTG